MGEMRGPAMAPLISMRGGGGDPHQHRQHQQQAERWSHFDNSVSAISFGFVATAILIAMFLVMAIFERFLRPRSPFLSSHVDGRGPRGRSTGRDDLEAQQRRNYSAKLDYPSPKMSIYAKGVSVLMPGNDVPTFIAHPAPAPCPPERISWPPHQHIPIVGSSSISNSDSGRKFHSSTCMPLSRS